MPHCLAKQITLPPLPFWQDGYEFVFEVFKEGDCSQSLILVRFGESEFFLRKRYRRKSDDFILKCEKISKNLPTGVIKGAIRILAQYNQPHLITHNLNNDSLKQNLISPFYKRIEDFEGFNQPFRLEIGFGSGRHLLAQAEKNPQVQWIGIELHTPSIEQVLRQIELRCIENIWIVNFDARVFLELLPQSMCEAIYLHFPVPWGKKPHRRVWSKRFLEESLRILKEGGMLELRSDDEEYFLYALEIALQEKALKCQIHKNLQKEVVSKYEDRWLRQQKNIYDLQVFALKQEMTLQHFNSGDEEAENKGDVGLLEGVKSMQKEQKSRERCLENHQVLDRDYCNQRKKDERGYDFSFPLKLFLRSFDTIARKVIGDDWFLHIDSFYSSRELSVLMLSFGDFNQPQSKFLLISNDGEARYLGGNPLPTRATYRAHLELLKTIAKERD